MNEPALKINEELIEYQTRRLQQLITEVIECCEDRKLYEARKFGLPYAEVKCLLLFQGERYLTVKGISQKLDIAKSRVIKILEGLIRKGLVEKREDPKDARVKLISLTRLGEEKSAELDAFHGEIHRKLLLQMHADDRKHVLSYLDMLHSAMEAVKEQLV
jgi:DNA-binding MarR family transcriptional regulator